MTLPGYKEAQQPMAWNNSGGPSPWGNPRPGGPWGAPPPPSGGGGGGGRGPDLDDAIRQAQDFVRRYLLPFGNRGGGLFAVVAVILVGLWGATGIYRVDPDEQGVVLRFGAFDRTAPPGLNYHIPWPFESVTTPRVTRINRVEVGYRAPADAGPNVRPVGARDIPEESLMLTGDENIVDIDFAVFWRISDAGQFLFNTRSPDATVKSAAESVVREVVGRTPIQPVLGPARAQIEAEVRRGTQAIMDQYRSGVEITQVQLQEVGPPAQVVDAFRDVQRAGADRERAVNQAQADRNQIIPVARGQAERLVQEAQGFRESQVARARGEAARFVSVLSAYQAAQDVTVRRIYLETMEDILRRNPKVLVDNSLQGIVPLLNLSEPARAGAPAAPSGPPLSFQPLPNPSISGRGIPR